MKIQQKKFAQLDTQELYNILALRTEIFVVEQQCAYQEEDFFDQSAIHFLGVKDEGQLIAYARLVEAGGVYEQPSIGRVAVRREFRGQGYGRQIFNRALNVARQKYSGQEIKIQAQCYLEEFYKSCGFTTISEPYPDFGIWHVDMITLS